MIRNPFARDLILLHPPALDDFRTRDTFLGPVADAVPSTSMFEMYPIGLTSIAAFLERNHYNVEIVNIAYRMLRDRRFDVDAEIRRLAAPVFGIDLHWLPHAQGALALADRVKRIHPTSKVLLGGLSASYYHEEAVQHPSIDLVLRGDSTEEPVRQLLRALREGRPLDEVENLTWKRADGTTVVNPLTFVPETLDELEIPAYRYLLRSVFKYRSLRNVIPCLEWLRYPITVLLGARGCTEDCAVCGGSRSAYRRICNRQRPAFRSPARLADDVRTIGTFSRAPIFLVHDPRMGGMTRARDLLARLATLRTANELIFELYYPAGDRFFDLIQRSVGRWSVEITLESPDEPLRKLNGKWPWPNARVEATIESALAHGCRTLDVFFMTGLPHQTRDAALAIPDYCEHLLRRFGGDRRLRPFIAPLGPFLDPGSRAFEDPSLGYHRFCTTLEDHRHAFLRDGWQRILSYQTDAMTRKDIADVTYEAAERLNDLKAKYRLIDAKTHAGVASRLQAARRILAIGDPGRISHAALELANHGTMFGDDELKWPVRDGFRVGSALMKSLSVGLVEEIAHTASRLLGRYDCAPGR